MDAFFGTTLVLSFISMVWLGYRKYKYGEETPDPNEGWYMLLAAAIAMISLFFLAAVM